MSPVRVLEMIDRPFLGGGQVNLLSLIRSLDRDVFECGVCAGGGGPLVEAVERAGCPFFPVSIRKRPDPQTVRDLKDVIRRFRPDILHTHGGVAGLSGRLAARGPGRPRIIHTLHGIHYLHYRNPLMRAALIGLEKFLSRTTEAVICVSAGDLERARRFRLAPRDRLVLIRNGIDLKGISPFSRGEDPAGAGGEGGAGPVVGTVARLHPQKGLAYLIDAVGRVRDAVPETRFRIVGDGPLREDLSERIRRKGCESAVELLGERTDAAALLSEFDIFVLPSLWEGLPYALLEAGARRKPVIASDIEGNRELIVHGLSGWLVPPANPEALAEGIVELLRDRGKAARLGEKLFDRVARDFTLMGMVNRTAALYLRRAPVPDQGASG